MISNKEKPQVVTLRIPAELNEELNQYLQVVGASKNSYILTLIAKDLECRRLPPDVRRIG